MSKAMSMTHEAVARAVKKLGLDSAAQHIAGYGLPMVDIAIEAKDHDIAMMVHPPHKQPLCKCFFLLPNTVPESNPYKLLSAPSSPSPEISSSRFQCSSLLFAQDDIDCLWI